MGGIHTRPHRGKTDDWLTPPELLAALGPFDLDPCASASAPWLTAAVNWERDGLTRKWPKGRFVWLNPPYGPATGVWLAKLARHGNGLALIFARTETEWFVGQVWERATALYFLAGRLHFHHPVSGVRAKGNSGGPSVLAAYGEDAAGRCGRLAGAGIRGHLVRLRGRVMASVRIEDEAFVDTRIELLGTLAGYNRFEALGRMAHLWRVCTQRTTYVLSEVWVAACLGDKGVEAIVQAGLGERVDGGIRIKGTAGRIEWLRIRREAARSGGKSTQAKGQAKGKQTPSKSQANANPVKQTPSKGEANPEQGSTKGVANGCPPTPTPVKEDKPASQACGEAAAPARVTPDSPHHRCIAHFTVSWQKRYGVKYEFDGAKDATAVKNMLAKVEGDEGQLRAVMDRYFADDEEFVTQTRHSMGLLLSQFPRWLVDSPAPRPKRPPPRNAGEDALDLIEDALRD